MLNRLSKSRTPAILALSAFVGAALAAPGAFSEPALPATSELAAEGIISTQTLIDDLRGGDIKASLRKALDRTEVVELLQANGVRAVDAQARVAALTDAEAQMLATKFDELPAGGDVTLLLVIIILILLLR